MFLENPVSCRQECEVQCYRELIVQYVGNYALFLLRIWSSQHVKNLDLNLLYSHIPHYSILCFLTTSQHRVCAVKWIENIDSIFGSEDKYSQNRSKSRHAKHFVIPHWTINLKMMPWEVIRWPSVWFDHSLYLRVFVTILLPGKADFSLFRCSLHGFSFLFFLWDNFSCLSGGNSFFLLP